MNEINRKRQQNRKKAKKRKIAYKIKVFSLTLSAFLMVGIIALFLVQYKQVGKPLFLNTFTEIYNISASLAANGDSVELNWENIPSSESTENQDEEDLSENEQTIRNDYGKIVKEILPEKDEITFLFAGDVLLDDSYTPMYYLKARTNGILDCFSEDTLQIMNSADVFMLNNEFTYTTQGTPILNKEFTFRSNPENVKMLDKIGVDIVSLANNHAYDYGEISLLDSLNTLNDDNMAYVGAGHNIDEASTPMIFQNDNMSIAVISATQIERLDNPDTKGATEDTAGVFRCWQSDRLISEVEKSKAGGNFTIVYVHWGTESTTVVDSYQSQLASELVEAGADLIIGDHPHVLQEITQIDSVPIIYSLGNYWFNSSDCETCLVSVTLKDNKIEQFRFIPARQSNCYTEILSGTEKDEALEKMRKLSSNITIDEDGYVTY